MYAASIARLSKKFRWPSWIVYDQYFRQEAADTGKTDWSKVESSIHSQCFTGMSPSAKDGRTTGYSGQRESLQACKPTQPLCLPSALVEITIPLISSVWESELANYPYQSFAAYVINGIKSANMVSAPQHPDLVLDYLQQEVLLDCIVVVSLSGP